MSGRVSLGANVSVLAKYYKMKAAQAYGAQKAALQKKFLDATEGVARQADAARDAVVQNMIQQLAGYLVHTEMSIDALNTALREDKIVNDDGTIHTVKSIFRKSLRDIIREIYSLVFATRGGIRVLPDGAMKYWLISLKCAPNGPEYLTEDVSDEDLQVALDNMCGSAQGNNFYHGPGQLHEAPASVARGRKNNVGMQAFISKGTNAAQEVERLRASLGSNPSAAQLSEFRAAVARASGVMQMGPASGIGSYDPYAGSSSFPRPGKGPGAPPPRSSGSGSGAMEYGGARKTRKGRKHRKHTRKAQRKGRKGTRK